jgi:hypothetical protein
MVSFSVGEEVLLSTKNIRLTTPKEGTKKLMPKWMGPLTVIDRIGEVAYRLALPAGSNIHNVFHVSLLKGYVSDGTHVPPPSAPIEVQGERLYNVEAIIEHRDIKKKGRRIRREYLVSWEGYGPEHNSWEPENNLKHNVALRAYWEGKAEGAPEVAPRQSKRDRPSSLKASDAGEDGSSPNTTGSRRVSKRLRGETADGVQ